METIHNFFANLGRVYQNSENSTPLKESTNGPIHEVVNNHTEDFAKPTKNSAYPSGPVFETNVNADSEPHCTFARTILQLPPKHFAAMVVQGVLAIPPQHRDLFQHDSTIELLTMVIMPSLTALLLVHFVSRNFFKMILVCFQLVVAYVAALWLRTLVHDTFFTGS